jgi:adenosylcobyric acid synthase
LEQAQVSGYEIHMGMSRGAALRRPLARWENTVDGAVSQGGHIIGTYLHGLFDAKPARDTLLRWAGLTVMETPDYQEQREASIEQLADALERCLDQQVIEDLIYSAHRSRGG